MSFQKGFIYIVKHKHNDLWYLVRQIGMKSWVAIQFTDAEAKYEDAYFKGNGVDLFADIVGARREFKRFRVIDKKLFRQNMFDILQYGYFKD